MFIQYDNGNRKGLVRFESLDRIEARFDAETLKNELVAWMAPCEGEAGGSKRIVLGTGEALDDLVIWTPASEFHRMVEWYERGERLFKVGSEYQMDSDAERILEREEAIARIQAKPGEGR